jgi:hypothetical protein
MYGAERDDELRATPFPPAASQHPVHNVEEEI